ncbi:MAG: hypothetical protein M1819_006280 [Sarea resinae]|nr:MAG: hypothetical protein M1819_006280 [Sarea resinae]
MAGLVLAAGVYGVGWSIDKIRTHHKNRKARKTEYAARFAELQATNAARVHNIETSHQQFSSTSRPVISVHGCQCQCPQKQLHPQSLAALPEGHTCTARHVHLCNRIHSDSCGSGSGSEAGTMISSTESMVVANGRVSGMSEESVVYEDEENVEDWPPPPRYEEVCGARRGRATATAMASGR